MPASQSYEVHVIPSENLTEAQHEAIETLQWESLLADFPDRTDRELATFMLGSARNRRDPNLAVGGATIRKDQSYTEAVNVLLTRDDRLVAQLPVANNASSSLQDSRWTGMLPEAARQFGGAVERNAKLHLPVGRLIGSRWIWHGLANLSLEARREIQDTGPDTFGPIETLIYAGSAARDRRQPMSAWPYDQEAAWKEGLARNEFEHHPEDDRRVWAFHTAFSPVTEEHWTAASWGAVEERMVAKDGAAAAINRMRRQL